MAGYVFRTFGVPCCRTDGYRSLSQARAATATLAASLAALRDCDWLLQAESDVLEQLIELTRHLGHSREVTQASTSNSDVGEAYTRVANRVDRAF